MTVSRFALLGYGRFGRAFADMLHAAGHDLRVYDPQAEVPAAFAAPSLAAAVEGADWIVLAMPVPFVHDALLDLRPHLQPGQAVIDVGSVKLHPCTAMDELLGADIAHAGTHPLFGPISLARGDKPRRVVICPAAGHPRTAERAAALFRSLDCEVIEQDPANHDRAMARTHAMAFFVAKGLIEFGVEDSMALAPPSFQGMHRMLDAVRGDAGHLFAAIQRENPFAAEAREQLIDALQKVHDQLQTTADDASLTIRGLDADT